MPSDTDLHKAANQGDAAEVQELLAEGADVDAPGAQKRTALHRALGSGHVEVAQILLEKGADATVVDSCKRTSARGRDALEPMHTAAPHTFIKLPSTAAPLAGGARTDGEAHPCVCVCDLFVGLHWAALAPEEKGAHECSKILFAKDGITSLINTQSSSMSTPLHCALSRGHTELVKLLVEMKADVEIKDEDGKKASDLAKSLTNSKEVRACDVAAAREGGRHAGACSTPHDRSALSSVRR